MENMLRARVKAKTSPCKYRTHATQDRTHAGAYEMDKAQKCCSGFSLEDLCTPCDIEN